MASRMASLMRLAARGTSSLATAASARGAGLMRVGYLGAAAGGAATGMATGAAVLAGMATVATAPTAAAFWGGKSEPRKKGGTWVGKDGKPLGITLYQYEVCPFCNKVRAFLDFHGIPYTVVEVNPMSKAELKSVSLVQKKKEAGEKVKVPVVVLDNGREMCESGDIITEIAKEFGLPARDPKAEDAQEDEECKWRRWSDETLVHTLPPNIYRTRREALQAFEYITEMGNFSAFQRLYSQYGGAAAMYFVSGRLKKKHNIEDEREALYACARDWEAALAGRKFLGGNEPNLGDLAVYGVLRSIEGLDAYADMRAATGIGRWYDEMRSAVGDSSRTNNHSMA